MTFVNSSRLMAKSVLTRRVSLLPRRFTSTTSTSLLPALTLVGQGAITATDETAAKQWIRLVALAAAATVASLGIQQTNKTDCCGIAGVVASEQHDARYVRFSDHQL